MKNNKITLIFGILVFLISCQNITNKIDNNTPKEKVIISTKTPLPNRQPNKENIENQDKVNIKINEKEEFKEPQKTDIIISNKISEYMVNTSTKGSQTNPVIDFDKNNNYIFMWINQKYNESNMIDFELVKREFKISGDYIDKDDIFLNKIDVSSILEDWKLSSLRNIDYLNNGNFWGYGFIYSNDLKKPERNFGLTPSFHHNFLLQVASEGNYISYVYPYLKDIEIKIINTTNTDQSTIRIEHENKENDPSPWDHSTIQKEYKIDINSKGNFVIAWSSEIGEFKAKKFTKNSSKYIEGEEINININTKLFLDDSFYIKLDENDNFIVLWLNSNKELFFETFNNDFNKRVKVADLNFSTENFTYPRDTFHVAINKYGNFIVVWEQNLTDNDINIYSKVFDIKGEELTDIIFVNDFRKGIQEKPFTDINDEGKIIITWQSENQDNELFGIYAREYNLKDIIK